jgi:hypothetical protein
MDDLDIFREGCEAGITFDEHGMFAEEAFFAAHPTGMAEDPLAEGKGNTAAEETILRLRGALADIEALATTLAEAKAIATAALAQQSR